MNASFSEAIYTVNEKQMSLPICIILDGLIEREVKMMLFAEDHSAIGKRIAFLLCNIYNPLPVALEDYGIINSTVFFDADSSKTVCRNIPIVFDEILENTEHFVLTLNTSDPGVNILRPQVSVFIQDNSSK